LTSFTGATNLTGHPSLTIPVGKAPCMEEDIQSEGDKDIRLPVGMMMMGKHWDEETLFKIGDAWEQSVDWKTLSI
jgi:amidase